jgi:hypothetical protein
MNKNNTNEIKQLNENLSNIFECLYSISKSLKTFEIIALNDSNYISKNKKEINLNVNKINEVREMFRNKT